MKIGCILFYLGITTFAAISGQSVRQHLSKLFIAFLLSGIFMQECDAQKKTGQPIDVVFCLDLSSSSNGLIDQFRDHLWDYWYFFTRCQPQPDYRIAVVTYARFSYGKQNGYAKVLKDLGTDFERLSNILYRIPSKIEKGDQYVGSALNVCLKKISWSKDPAAKKIIFLVGNGEVTLGSDDIDDVMEKLVSNNIIVNPIYIKAPGEVKAILGWEKIAQKGGGKIFTMSIHNRYFDRNNGFDMQHLRTLNRKLNNTYLFYGKGGRLRWRMIQDEDNHIYITNTEGFRFRSMYKISDDYQKKNYSWDLVDLYYKNPVAFMDIDRKFLNDTCKKMSNEQLKSYIIYKKYERRKLASMIAEMFADKKNVTPMKRTMPTLDILSLQIIGDLLKNSGCNCVTN